MPVFFEGQTPIQEGLYLRIATQTEILPATVSTGVAVALITAERGPLNEIVEVTQLGTVETRFGTGDGPDTANQVLFGGAPLVKVMRIDSGGVAASHAFTQTTPATAFTATAVDVGTDGNGLTATIEDDPANPTTRRRFLLYRDGTLVETHYFTKGSSGVGEPALLAAAINADSNIISTGAVTDGTKLMTAVSGVAFTAGASVTAGTTEWTDALTLLTGEQFNLLAISSESTTIWAALNAQLSNWSADGKFVIAVVGQSAATEALEADRISNIDDLDSQYMKGVVNGFTQDSVDYEGGAAAGRVVGMMSARRVTQSLTSQRVTSASAVVNPGEDFDAIVSAGAMGFRTSPTGNIVLSRDVTTLASPTSPMGSEWSYGRTTREMINFFDRLFALREQLIGGDVGNDDAGRTIVVTSFNNLIDDMIAENAFSSGEATEDPDNPPTGGTAFFLINFSPVGSLDQILVTVGVDF